MGYQHDVGQMTYPSKRRILVTLARLGRPVTNRQAAEALGWKGCSSLWTLAGLGWLKKHPRTAAHLTQFSLTPLGDSLAAFAAAIPPAEEYDTEVSYDRLGRSAPGVPGQT